MRPERATLLAGELSTTRDKWKIVLSRIVGSNHGDLAISSGARICADIDDALASAIRENGFPEWHTPGAGGRMPGRQAHVFDVNSLQEGARIDFYRGQASDDWHNDRCQRMLECMPRHRLLVGQNQGLGNT